MFRTNKKLKNLFLALGFASCVGLVGCCSHNVYENDNFLYQEKLNRKNITYDESTNTITYDNGNLTDYEYWLNVRTILDNNGYNSWNDRLTITGSYIYNDTTYSDINSVRVDGTSINFGRVSGQGIQITFTEDSVSNSFGITELSITNETFYNLVNYSITFNQDDTEFMDNLYTWLVDNGYTSSNKKTSHIAFNNVIYNQLYQYFNGNPAIGASITDNTGSLYFNVSTTVLLVNNSTTYNEYSVTITDEDIYNAFAPAPAEDDLPQVLNDFVSILVGGIQDLASGIASGVTAMASALFLQVDDGVVSGLSVFGGIVAIFAGLALAVALTSKVYAWITSLGN